MGKMRGGLFDYNGRTIFRVDRRMARSAYSDGYTILICPVNIIPGQDSGGLVYQHNRADNYGFMVDRWGGAYEAFDAIAEFFKAYNCEGKRGRYPAFYMFADETRTED